jgi:lipoprotein-anchoring transpeptidase ErfK/SrfK
MPRSRLLSTSIFTLAFCLGAVSHTQASNLGGGLIEFVVTGGAMESRPAPQRQDPMITNAPQPRAVQASLGTAPVAREVPAEFHRTEVSYEGGKPGAIVVDTPNHFLYLVTGPGRAMRYGIGVGRPGFTWAGVKNISRKAEWPDWTPPPEMLKRRPDLPTHMDGGEGNPLGARALYLGSSVYRIHGTTEPWTIGQNVSSGCIRMMNEDVIDLYERVKVGTQVTVL